ncbi:hypothetical protein ALGA_0424 [Labilibaculum antarcticum]|uniref:Uncharacterized protein n=1 Tax=Labilibaculum antarcticum TaxID=1717717 RepID=A0A1Y1CEN5_9BACT|nr:hypothetical protein ALGA_0424 [Labilibaculum antarcticum]
MLSAEIFNYSKTKQVLVEPDYYVWGLSVVVWNREIPRILFPSLLNASEAKLIHLNKITIYRLKVSNIQE